MMKRIGGAVALVALASLGSAAFAHDMSTPEGRAKDIATTRHGLFHVIGASFAPVGAMMSNHAPFDAKGASLAGTRLEVLAGMIKELTAVDTTKLVPNTGDRPIIWTERADFEGKADNLLKAATALEAAADRGDKDATMKAAHDVAGACNACHAKFRKDDDD